MLHRKPLAQPDRPATPAAVDLDALDLSGLLPLAEALLRSLEDYQRHAAAAGFRVTTTTVRTWVNLATAALAVEAELSRLGLPARISSVSGVRSGKRWAVDDLREWLLRSRG